ncbi:hypothetical protein GQX73_g4818 [Xylaria multiplex]|uniref:C3H1-type domain-containing protein n=1 Tax=Xylaria multiplex TaxID=323545 RepID=A0A7C8IP77_9PEZI|nr:hypothetical protein GQX73_g4818 [Xylaria multiplex]
MTSSFEDGRKRAKQGKQNNEAVQVAAPAAQSFPDIILPLCYVERPGVTHHTASGTIVQPGPSVPLIAIDQLPLWVNVRGVPRELSHEQATKICSLGVVPRGKPYEVYLTLSHSQLDPTTQPFTSQKCQLADELATESGNDSQQTTHGVISDDRAGKSVGGRPLMDLHERLPSASSARSATSSPMVKTEVKKPRQYCKGWYYSGKCKWEGNCRYLHEVPETAQELKEAGFKSRPSWLTRLTSNNVQSNANYKSTTVNRHTIPQPTRKSEEKKNKSALSLQQQQKQRQGKPKGPKNRDTRSYGDGSSDGKSGTSTPEVGDISHNTTGKSKAEAPKNGEWRGRFSSTSASPGPSHNTTTRYLSRRLSASISVDGGSENTDEIPVSSNKDEEGRQSRLSNLSTQPQNKVRGQEYTSKTAKTGRYQTQHQHEKSDHQPRSQTRTLPRYASHSPDILELEIALAEATEEEKWRAKVEAKAERGAVPCEMSMSAGEDRKINGSYEVGDLLSFL